LNNIFYEMIFKRKSFHIFRNVGNESISKDELNDIQSVYSEFTPLNPGIKTAIRIVPEKQTNCERGGEYCVLLYSEKKDGYLQNIGYLGEQLDLYLVSRNIGTLWFGIGKTQEKPFADMEFVIMLSIRKISDDSKYRIRRCTLAANIQMYPPSKQQNPSVCILYASIRMRQMERPMSRLFQGRNGWMKWLRLPDQETEVE